ncbi:MAG: anthranilate synthase component I family protein, partial [Sphingobacteriales bacterium]
YRDELLLCENEVEGLPSERAAVESLLFSKDVPVFPFARKGGEERNMEDEDYHALVRAGIGHCHRGDVFQIVLSRRFAQGFRGDEFNVYRALRHINPSPYLFFFDYGDYRLMGSSPEAQLVLQKGTAVMHPIAGTFRRSGNDVEDARRAEELLLDPKENAEHVMLVDLARNDLSTICSNVEVTRYRQVQYYSHVIHLVSEVSGKVPEGTNPFEVLFRSFPAGTLCGAPKYRALQLIDSLEPTARSYYGGAIGFVGFNGSCNHAIMIRTFLSRNNTLFYQAGAGVVAASAPENERQEVDNKLNALRKALELAETITPTV